MTTDGPILLVEDDAEIRALVAALLEREGYAVETARDGVAMDALRARVEPRAIILDVMLPGEDGFAICRRLRAEGDVPILMLTARGDAIDRIVGLEIGADDYLPKPFEPRELLARLKALLRRSDAVRRIVAGRGEKLLLGDVTIDLAARMATRDGRDGGAEDLCLTSAEFDLLAAFCAAPGRVLSRDHLLDRVHGRGAGPFDRSIDMLVSRLRKKLEPEAERPAMIKTVRNAGYILVAPLAPADASSQTQTSRPSPSPQSPQSPSPRRIGEAR